MKITVIASIALFGLGFAQVALPAQPTVEVLRPNSGDRLQPGSIFRIQWRASTTNTDWSFELFSSRLPHRYFLYAPEPIYDGEGLWHADVAVPGDLPSACDYTLKINDDVAEVYDDSDVFCLGVPLVSISVSQVEICWTSRSNRMYQVQYRSTLTTNLWTNLGTAVQGSGFTNCITDAVVPGQPQRYYRVEELP